MTVTWDSTLRASPREGGLAQQRDQPQEESLRTLSQRQHSALSSVTERAQVLARESLGMTLRALRSEHLLLALSNHMLTLQHACRFTDSFRTKLFGQAKRNPGLSVSIICPQRSLHCACEQCTVDDASPADCIPAVLPEGEEDEFIREAATDSVRVHPLSVFR